MKDDAQWYVPFLMAVIGVGYGIGRSVEWKPPAGEQEQACYGNHTCNPGLICVRYPVDGYLCSLCSSPAKPNIAAHCDRCDGIGRLCRKCAQEPSERAGMKMREYLIAVHQENECPCRTGGTQ